VLNGLQLNDDMHCVFYLPNVIVLVASMVLMVLFD
jgi:hypothetical protein